MEEAIVIGAGLIGSSVAMHLARLGMAPVRVLDFDLRGEWSSSELNAGGVRATWLQPINIQTSKISIQYFASIAQEIGYRDCGYVWLIPPEKESTVLKGRELQQKMGWPVEIWDISELQRHLPFINKTQGIACALFAPRDGIVNSNLLKKHFRQQAQKRGVVFDDRILIRQAEYSPTGVTLVCEQWDNSPSSEQKLEILSGRSSVMSSLMLSGMPSRTVRYQAERVVNCAGPWAPELAKLLGYSCPSHPSRRQVCMFDCRDVDLSPFGMIVDTSGVYFHPEGGNGLAGFGNAKEPAGVNFHYEGEQFFMESIWPALYERSTAFERLRHLTGWAGLYEISPDESAILGCVETGEAGQQKCVYEAHSFSGHGAMHSYGAGLALAEKMVHGRFETFDASELSGKRFEGGKWIQEGWVI